MTILLGLLFRPFLLQKTVTQRSSYNSLSSYEKYLFHGHVSLILAFHLLFFSLIKKKNLQLKFLDIEIFAEMPWAQQLIIIKSSIT